MGILSRREFLASVLAGLYPGGSKEPYAEAGFLEETLRPLRNTPTVVLGFTNFGRDASGWTDVGGTGDYFKSITPRVFHMAKDLSFWLRSTDSSNWGEYYTGISAQDFHNELGLMHEKGLNTIRFELQDSIRLQQYDFKTGYESRLQLLKSHVDKMKEIWGEEEMPEIYCSLDSPFFNQLWHGTTDSDLYIDDEGNLVISAVAEDMMTIIQDIKSIDAYIRVGMTHPLVHEIHPEYLAGERDLFSNVDSRMIKIVEGISSINGFLDRNGVDPIDFVEIDFPMDLLQEGDTRSISQVVNDLKNQGTSVSLFLNSITEKSREAYDKTLLGFFSIWETYPGILEEIDRLVIQFWTSSIPSVNNGGTNVLSIYNHVANSLLDMQYAENLRKNI